MTGKGANRGARLGLEIPVNYFFSGDARLTTWVKNGLEKLNELHVKVKNKEISKVNKVKNKIMHMFSFSQPVIWCPLLRGKFCPKFSRDAQKK